MSNVQKYGYLSYMEVNKFNTYHEFSDWFSTAGISDCFPLISKSHRGNANRKFLDIYYAVEDNNIIGISLCGKHPKGNSYHINLFEINSNFRKKGYGTIFFQEISKLIGDRAITLFHKGDKDGEAYLFWKKMGFVYRYNDYRHRYSHEMINAKYANAVNSINSNSNGRFIRVRTVVRDIGGKIEITRTEY